MTISSNNLGNGVTYQGAVSASTLSFVLKGGMYYWYSTAASTSQILNILMPDGTTVSPVNSQTTAAVGVALSLPPGTYSIVWVATGAVQGGILPVPYNPSY